MIVRVDTTNITRGLDFSIIVQTDIQPVVSLYAFNTSSHEYETLDFSIVQSGVFYKANSKAPYFDGYILAKINGKSVVVKKVGHPTQHFVIGYKENYTIPYELISEDGIMQESGNLINIVDGFYYCEIQDNITIMKTLKKRFIIKDNMTKLNYDVSMGTSTLQSVELPNYTLDAILGNAELQDISLDDVSLNATLPNVTISEY